MPDDANKPWFYIPTDNPGMLRLLSDAVSRNDAMDRAGRAAGFADPLSGGPTELARCAISAIICGVETADAGPLLEGLAMLIQLEFLVRQLAERFDIVVKKT